MLTPIQVYRGLRAVVRVASDPTRLDEVFVLADMAEESPQLAKLVDDIRKSPLGARVLRERPRLGRVDLDELGELAPGTLGRAYAEFMRERGIVHENLLLIDGERELDFVRNHLRETHDIWHVATGFDTDVAGELGLQAFYLAQFSGPLPVLLLAVGMINTLFRAMSDSDRRMQAIARGWLLGRRAHPLFGTRWADHWARPLKDLRGELGIDVERIEQFMAESEPSELFVQAA